MPSVKMYRSDIEQGAKAGEEVTVSTDRAAFLVVNGYATYARRQDAQQVPPVGGLRPNNRLVGTEGATEPGYQTYAQEKADTNPPGEGTKAVPAADGPGPYVRR